MTSLQLATTERLRHASLPDLMTLLQKQSDLRYDVVVPASALTYDAGLVKVTGGAMRFDDLRNDFVERDAFLRPTAGCEDQFADALGIPTRYMRSMRTAAGKELAEQNDIDGGGTPDFCSALLDHNVNYWLDRDPNRRFLLRGFRTDDPDEVGVARALLSNKYGAMDHIDVLMAAMKGINDAGLNVRVEGCDLTERRMQVRITAPEITALAPALMRGYRSPFREDREDGAGIARFKARAEENGLQWRINEPVIWAGLVIANSETGDGAVTLTPRVMFPICTNGMTVKKDALRNVHLGGRLDDGVIQWSQETVTKAVELITSKTKDAVKTFLSTDYLEQLIADIEGQAVTPVHPVQAVEQVSNQFAFSEAEQDAIMAAFVAGGQMNAGGVMQAVTAAAQTCDDPDRAEHLEASALDVLEFAATAAS